MKFKYVFSLGLIVFASGCSTGVRKITLDESKDMPNWIEKNDLSWEDGDKIYFKAKQTIRADQRVNGCYGIASLDNKETLLKGVADNIKGTIDNSELDLSENAELVLGKARSSEWSGRITGLHDKEQVFQRYSIGTKETFVERQDCWVLSEISKADYLKVKQQVLDQVVKADPRIKDAIINKQVDFFSNKSTEPNKENATRETASASKE